MAWSWSDAYPDCQVVTLVLDPVDADTLMVAARTEGAAIGKATIRGLPTLSPVPRLVSEPAEIAADGTDGKALPHAEPSVCAGPLPPAAATAEAPPSNVTILPVVRREPMAAPESASAIRALQPPRAEPPSAVAKAVEPATRELIDAAIAAGKIIRCPPCKHSVEPGEWLPGEGGWRDPNKRPGKGRRGRFDFKKER